MLHCRWDTNKVDVYKWQHKKNEELCVMPQQWLMEFNSRLILFIEMTT
jgi:hypothetical protein